MKILYYNLQLGCFDGSNSHAVGMLQALRRIYGEGNVVVANEYVQQTYNHAAGQMKARLGAAIDIARMIRKKGQAAKVTKRVLARVHDMDFKPDLLLARSTLYDDAPARIAQRLGCRLVVETNTPLEYECCDLRHASFRPLVRRFERRLYESADGIYAVSSVLKEMISASYGISDDKIKVVPNGFSSDLYSDYPDRHCVRSRVRSVESVEDALVVTFVGSLQTWHGIERLVEIADLVRNRLDSKRRRIVFWVLGDGAKRELVQERSSGASDFFWFGNVEPQRMKELLYASDLGIMPYERVDCFYFSPLKMFDMIGAGLPYIGLRIGQISELSPQLICDYCLLDTTDPRDYVKVIERFSDGGDLRPLADSISSVRTACSWDARARELDGWMQGLIGR